MCRLIITFLAVMLLGNLSCAPVDRHPWGHSGLHPNHPGLQPAPVTEKNFDDPPKDPWMPWSAETRGTGIAHCGPWFRTDSPQYRSIQVNVDHRGCNIVGDAANEPSIALDPTNPRRIVIGWRQFDTIESDFRQAGYAYSHDAGHTWVFPGVLAPGVFGSDPVLEALPNGTVLYINVRLLPLEPVFKSSDGGVTWDRSAEVRTGDKPWMTIDRSNEIGRGNIYIASGGYDFSRSTDAGVSFDDFRDNAPYVRYPTLSVGPDGTLYAVGGNYYVVFTRSTDAKDPDQEPTFEPLRLLEMGGRLQVGAPPNGGLMGQIWVATDHSDGPTRGNVYLLGSVSESIETEADVNFIRSTDGGETWSEKLRVNDDPEGNGAWQWFGMMSVAPNGRIDAVWNDTRNYPEPLWQNLCELYYSYSNDAGVTWSTNIPLSPMFDSRIGWPAGQNKLGDYYHMISDNLGVNVAYAATFNAEQDVYFLRIGPWDCNGNEVPDEDDIACGGDNVCNDLPGSYDCNGNSVPDECEYRADFDGDGLTTLRDVAALQRCFGWDGTALGSEGGSEPTDPCCQLFDLDEDNRVTTADLPAMQRVMMGP